MGADATLSGHNHVYERVLVDGFPYLRVSARLYILRDDLPAARVALTEASDLDYPLSGPLALDAESYQLVLDRLINLR